MVGVTMKLLATSLWLSRWTFSHLDRLFILDMTTLWWYVDMQLKIFHVQLGALLQLFGWDLASLWMTANQKRCHALLQAGELWEAIGSYQYIMDVGDITTKADALDWSTGKSSVVNISQSSPVSFSFQARMQRALCCQRRCCLRCK
jgi:hypothetical protein